MAAHRRRIAAVLFAACIGSVGAGAAAPTLAAPAEVFLEPAPRSGELRLSTLLGLTVENLRGYEFGQVRDVVIDPRDAAVRFLAVEREGIGAPTVALRPGEYRVSTGDTGVVHTPAPDTRLTLRIDEGAAPEVADLDAVERGSARVVGRGVPATPAVRGSRLIGAAVRGSAGDALGAIRDAVLDPVDGGVRHVVISIQRTTR